MSDSANDETSAAPTGADWETEPAPVGLDSINPEIVEITKNVSAEVADSGADGSSATGDTKVNLGTSTASTASDTEKRPSTAPAGNTKGKDGDLSFQPRLISSARKRAKASSTGYGSKVIGKKPPKPSEQPPFAPMLNVGKITQKKREKASGSQYGKFVPKKKPVRVEPPSFTPELTGTGPTKEIREKAKSKIYDAAKKRAVQGKELRAELSAEREAKEFVPRYTLAADHSTANVTEQPLNKPPMILDGPSIATSTSEQVQKGLINKQLGNSPPKRSKLGEKLLKKAVSHYDTGTYTPPKVPKVVKPEQPLWKGAKLPVADAADLPPVANNKKTTNAVSKYGKDYVPPKAPRPVTPKSTSPTTRDFVTTTLTESPLDIPLDELPVPKNRKNKAVSSSGYGVVSPAPSVAKKVESYKVRSKTNLLNTKSARDGAEVVNGTSEAEKENPAIDANVINQPIVDDLLNRAAMLDSKSKPAVTSVDPEDQIAINNDVPTPVSDSSESEHVASETVSDVPSIVASGVTEDGAQLTML